MNNNKSVCCVCHHLLGSHIDETDGWRCHSLDESCFQCECFLRKRNSFDGKPIKISYYDIQKRVKEYLRQEKVCEKARCKK